MDCRGQIKDAVTVHRLLTPEPVETPTAAEIRLDLEIIEATASNVQQFARVLAERYHNSRFKDSHLEEQIEFLKEDVTRLIRYIARLQGRR